MSVKDTIDNNALAVPIEERLRVEPLVTVIMNFDSDGIEEYDVWTSSLYGRGSYSYASKNFDLHLKKSNLASSAIY